jgi:hypothetical protein
MYPNSGLPNFSHPSLANGHSAIPVPSSYVFPDVPECHFAEQLTRMDMVSMNQNQFTEHWMSALRFHLARNFTKNQQFLFHHVYSCSCM